MATFRTFQEIQAWQKARELASEVYAFTREAPFARDRGLCDQIRRAVASIMSNIAEGFERNGRKEFLQYLAMAKGSAGEVSSQLFIALDQGYLNEVEFKRLRDLSGSVSRLIGGLMEYLRSASVDGSKYRGAPTRNPKPETRNLRRRP